MPRKRKPTTEKKRRRSTDTYARKYADEEAFTLLLFSPWLLFGVMMRWLLCVTPMRGPFLSFFFSGCPLFPPRPRSFGPRLTLSPKGGEERESARETEKARRGAKSRSWAFSLYDPPQKWGGGGGLRGWGDKRSHDLFYFSLFSWRVSLCCSLERKRWFSQIKTPSFAFSD